jgi:hypothetical protein
MFGTHQVEFDSTLAMAYMPRRVVKQAVLVPVPNGVKTTINADWGTPQSFVGPWYAIYVDGKVAYGSGKTEFEETHEVANEVENGFFKNTPIEAYIYRGDKATVVTVLASGVQETVNKVTDGDWLVRWPHGEVGVMNDAKFRKLYDVAEGV